MAKLLILSDLWGNADAQWLSHYKELLSPIFDIVYYDSAELASIDTDMLTEEYLHQQYINGGIDRAVESLINREKEEVSVLGFSIGGTIVWKAGLAGLKIKNLTAVSSTRLRHENMKPNTKINLYYGELDPVIPDINWFARHGLDKKLFEQENHTCYWKQEIAQKIFQEIRSDISN